MTSVPIAYVVSQYPASSHTFIRREVVALRERGLDVQTFSIRAPSPAECVAPADRAARDETFYVLPARPAAVAGAHVRAVVRRPRRYGRTLATSLRHRVPGARGLLRSVFYFGEAIILAAELDRRGVRRVHNHFANAGANVGMLAAHHLGLPWSLTLHGISETDYPAGVMLGRKVEAADFVACVSYFGRAQAMRLVDPDQWDKLFVSRCAVDLDQLPERATSKGGRPRPRVVCVGRLSAEKGHAGLLEAFDAARHRGVDADLVLVGDGPERESIEAAVAARGLGDRVSFAGRLPEADTLDQIAAGDVLVLPSFMEGLPVVLMEAMALGVPTVSSRVAGVPELIDDGHDGLLFTPGRWPELADALVKVLSDAGVRAELAVAARATIEAEFEIHRAVEELAHRLQQ